MLGLRYLPSLLSRLRERRAADIRFVLPPRPVQMLIDLVRETLAGGAVEDATGAVPKRRRVSSL